MTARKPPKQCPSCGNDLLVPQAKHCYKEECIRPYMLHRATTYVEKVGECEVWKGYVNKGVPQMQVRFGPGRGQRRNHRVLDVRRGFYSSKDADAQHNLYVNDCGTLGCCVPEHYHMRSKVELMNKALEKKRAATPKLPIEPLREWVQRNFQDRAIPDRIWYHLQNDQIDLMIADEICCDDLGIHPYAIFGELFFDAAA